MATLDIHNWGGNSDDGWTNYALEGTVYVYRNQKFYGGPPYTTWGHVGSYRTTPLDLVDGITFTQHMLVTADTYTDVAFCVHTDPSFNIYGSVGVYFAAYQTGPLKAYMWDMNTIQSNGGIGIDIIKNKFYTCKIVIADTGFASVYLNDELIGTTVNWGSGGPQAHLYGMTAFSQVGYGTGMAIIDNYKVTG
jgi:hypothetical protein